VELVQQTQDEFGLAPALAAVGLPRSTWYYRTSARRTYAVRYAHLRGPLEAIARAHPAYGYRRTTAELLETYGAAVNHKVVQRLHRLWGLPLVRGVKPPRPSGVRSVLSAVGARANLLTPRVAIGPLEVLHTDFTELVCAAGKAQLMVLLDHTSKVVPGWALGARPDTGLALAAWATAKRWLRRHDYSFRGLIVHHDQDPVYTGYGWTAQLLLRDHVRISYALAGCKDNPEMEAFHSRFKNENRSLLLEASSLAELRRVVGERIAYYNRRRRHSALGYQAPLAFLASLPPQR
jgi:putative transposase